MFLFPLVLRKIERAKDQEIQKILLAVIQWQKNQYPDEELVIVSLPKQSSGKRDMYLKMIMNLLQTRRLSDDF